MEMNESKKVDYFMCRFSLYKEEQIHINDILNPQTKEEVFNTFILKLKKRNKVRITCG